MTPSTRAPTERQIAFLRGINVGGKNKIAMPVLAALFTDAGASDVETYIQSGNVLFSAPPAVTAAMPERIRAALQKKLGLSVPVVVRSASALAATVNGNPFPEAAAEPKTLHVAFLADAPTAALVKALDPARSPPDRFVVKGADVYLHLPNGVAKTKLSNAWLDSKLETVSTMRNWSTVLELATRAGA